MKIQTVMLASCVLGAALAPPASAQWELFFDSEGFESMPVGMLSGTEPSFLPHVVIGVGSGNPPQLPHVVSSPDPTQGTRSIHLQPVWRASWDATSRIRYGHADVSFGRREFAFPGSSRGRGGYRGLRISFDMYHALDPGPDRVSWLVGGIEPRGGEPTAQVVWDVTDPLEPVFDEWVKVFITLDFENDLVAGSYAGHESELVAVPVEWPVEWREMWWWEFRVTAGVGDPPGPTPWMESVWLDNLVVEVIPPCPADCDLDYEHTFFDFLCFQNMFAAGNMRADCDLDDELTFFDFLCFQDYFATGCD